MKKIIFALIAIMSVGFAFAACTISGCPTESGPSPRGLSPYIYGCLWGPSQSSFFDQCNGADDWDVFDGWYLCENCDFYGQNCQNIENNTGSGGTDPCTSGVGDCDCSNYISGFQTPSGDDQIPELDSTAVIVLVIVIGATAMFVLKRK